MTKDDLQRLGDTAAQQFLTKGANMNETIAKMAEQYNMNPHQIQRVAEFANNTARATLYKDAKVDQAALVFPTAEASKIASMIPKEASGPVPLDYMVPPRSHRNETIEKRASAEDMDYSEINKFAAIREYRKADTQYHDAYDAAVMAKMAQDDAMAHLFKVGYQYLRENKDAAGFAKVAMAVAGDKFKEIYPLFKKGAPIDIRRQVNDMEPLMNPNIKATYVVNDHPLVITLKGYATASEDVQRSTERRDSLDVYRRGLHGYIEQEKFASPFGAALSKRAEPAPAPAPGTAPEAAKPSGGMGLGALLGLGFSGYEAYSGYKNDTGLFDQYRQMSKNPEQAGAYINESMKKYPQIYAKARQRMNLDWDNTPEDRALAARNKPKLEDDWSNFPAATEAQHERENLARFSNQWSQENT